MQSLIADDNLATQYSVAVSNSFHALDSLPDDIDTAWETVKVTIICAARDTLRSHRSNKRALLKEDTLKIVDKKCEARLQSDHSENRRLKGIFKARANTDLKEFYNAMADEAETGLRKHNLHPAFRAIKRLSKHPSARSRSPVILAVDGSSCSSSDEIIERWREHYSTTLNHAAATQCADLDAQANCALPSSDISSDPPNVEEVAKAIRKLKHSWAAGPDDIHPELLTCAIGPISSILHALFLKVWSSGLVPAEWHDCLSIQGERPTKSVFKLPSNNTILCPGKVFAHVLLAHIEPLLLAHRRPQQSGFTRSRSMMDAILAL